MLDLDSFDAVEVWYEGNKIRDVFLYLINVFYFVVFTKSNFVDLAAGKIMIDIFADN